MISIDDLQLRIPALEDAELILSWENNPEFWEVSDNNCPYVIEDIHALIQSFEDENSADQVRFLIESKKTKEIYGTIDLYNIDRSDKIAGVGILVAEKIHRRKGIARAALLLLERKALNYGVHTLKALVHTSNKPSVALFESQGYVKKSSNEPSTLINGHYIETNLYEKWINESSR